MLESKISENIVRSNIFSFASPPSFFRLATKLVPIFAAFAAVAGTVGLLVGFLLAPTDAQQGDAYRIIYLHVPAAWLSMILYVAMALWSALGLIYKTRASAIMANAIAPTGALLTFLALWTGSLWGKPTWGTWWVWDARLTSELVLLFLYIGYMALHASFDDVRRADKAAAILAIVGVVNVPIIYFSVRWWNTLHQGASIRLTEAPTMATPMLVGLLLMTVSFWAYAAAISLYRAKCILLERENGAFWTKEIGREM